MKGRNTWILVALVALLVLPSCRTRRKAVTPTTTPTTTTATAETTPPDVPPMPVTTDNRDFVDESALPAEPGVATADLPADPGEASEIARERGWIRDVYFEYDSSSLTPEGQEALAVTASWLKSNPGFGVLIEGHCDERGTEQYNLALGDRRANIAREYLATLGVPETRLRTVSYGEERPLVQGSGEAVWRQNRRAHLVLVRQ